MINLPPAGSYDSVLFFWFEEYMEDYQHKVLAGGDQNEFVLESIVAQGFSKNDRFLFCAVGFWKAGMQLDLWEQILSPDQFKKAV